MLVKLPVPEPLVVCWSLVVGVPVTFQQTPRAVMLALPLFVMSPPLVAVVTLMSVIALVVSVGIEFAVVVNVKSLP